MIDNYTFFIFIISLKLKIKITDATYNFIRQLLYVANNIKTPR